MNNTVKTPAYMITVDGQNITSTINTRLGALTFVDNRGFDADTLSLSIDDADGKVKFPKLGVKVSFSIGYKGEQLVDKGDFIVDAASHGGAVDLITISAKSADFRKKFIERKNKAYHQKTIKAIVEEIAKEHGWEAKVSPDLASIKIKDRQQSNESDANFLTRLAQEFDAIATVKKSTLLFLKTGEGKSASGQELPEIKIVRTDGDKHNFSINDRDAYTGVKAHWNSAKHGKRKEVLAGDEEKIYLIRESFKSEEEAQKACDNKLKQLKRGVATFSFSLAVGNPELMAESPVVVTGFKEIIDQQAWIATKVTLKLDATNGLTSEIEAEVKAEFKEGNK